MESFLKSFERREEKNSLPRGRRFLFKEGRKIGEETMNRLYRITINRSKKRMKIILGNLSKEGKKKIHFLEEEDFFLKREGK